MDKETDNEIPKEIQLPTPTAWPLITACGMALIFAGLITSFAITAVGLIMAIIGARGWFTDVFPHPKHEPFPIRPEAQRPAPVKTTSRSVAHLEWGKRGHRVRVPVEIHPYGAGVIGGLAGGAAMAILALLYGIVAQGSIWYPINLLAAAGVPELAQADLETLRAFSLLGFVVALVIHLILSVLIGLLYTVLLPMLPTKMAWFWGGIITPLMWTGLITASIDIVDPALAARIDWPWFVVCQVAFGMVGGYVIFKTEKVETMQAWPMAARMGVEAANKDQPEEEEPK